VHSPGPIIWRFKDLTIYLRASLFFVTFGARKNSSYTRTPILFCEVERTKFSTHEGRLPVRKCSYLVQRGWDNLGRSASSRSVVSWYFLSGIGFEIFM
jgi:hypothetical protein